jgi:hypothetical protein
MEIYEITGDDLRVLLNELSGPNDDTRIVRIAIDEGRVKVKVNEYDWTYGIGQQAREVLCADDDGAGACGHPESVHGPHGCTPSEPEVCWCDEFVSPESASDEDDEEQSGCAHAVLTIGTDHRFYCADPGCSARVDD